MATAPCAQAPALQPTHERCSRPRPLTAETARADSLLQGRSAEPARPDSQSAAKPTPTPSRSLPMSRQPSSSFSDVAFMPLVSHACGATPVATRLSFPSRAACPSAPPDARIGAVTFTHRAGASLNRHQHFHSIATDGSFELDHHGGLLFAQANLTDQDFTTLTETIRRRVVGYLVRHDLLDADDPQNMLTWQGSGGFSVHGAVTVERDDREGLERLVEGAAGRQRACRGSFLAQASQQACARSPWAQGPSAPHRR